MVVTADKMTKKRKCLVHKTKHLRFIYYACYFSRKKRLIIVPDNGHFSRILFSKKRL